MSLCHLIQNRKILAYVRKDKVIFRFKVTSLPYWIWYWLSSYIASLFSIKQKQLARLKSVLSQFLFNNFLLLSNYQDCGLWRMPWENALLWNLIWFRPPIYESKLLRKTFFSFPPWCFHSGFLSKCIYYLEEKVLNICKFLKRNYGEYLKVEERKHEDYIKMRSSACYCWMLGYFGQYIACLEAKCCSFCCTVDLAAAFNYHFWGAGINFFFCFGIKNCL